MARAAAPSSVGKLSRGPSSTTVEWKIRDYFNLPKEVDRSLKSPAFVFSDGVWYLKLYPSGKRESETEGWISVYLRKKHSEYPKHRMQYTVGVVGRDGHKGNSRSGTDVFEEGNKGFGWSCYLKASELNRQREALVPEGVLTIFCTLAMNMQDGVEAAVQTDGTPGAPKLVHDFEALFRSGEATDVTLAVQDRDYKVHWAVLAARSGVFAAMMKHDMVEKSSEVVHIHDCDPEAFQQFLRYVYTGDVESLSADTVFALHGIADKYQTDELKESCVQYVRDNLSVETFCDALSLSLRHDEAELLDKAAVFLAENMTGILLTPKWMSVLRENTVELNELLIKAARHNEKQNPSP